MIVSAFQTNTLPCRRRLYVSLGNASSNATELSAALSPTLSPGAHCSVVAEAVRRNPDRFGHRTLGPPAKGRDVEAAWLRAWTEKGPGPLPKAEQPGQNATVCFANRRIQRKGEGHRLSVSLCTYNNALIRAWLPARPPARLPACYRPTYITTFLHT